MTRTLPAFALLSLALAGCSGPTHQFAPVSGKVTWKGQPLAGADVYFAPTGGLDAGPSSTGKTDKDGRFKLRVDILDRDGAVVGNHVVRVSKYSEAKGTRPEEADAGSQSAKNVIPYKYNAESKLNFTVPAQGTDQANFDLAP